MEWLGISVRVPHKRHRLNPPSDDLDGQASIQPIVELVDQPRRGRNFGFPKPCECDFDALSNSDLRRHVPVCATNNNLNRVFALSSGSVARENDNTQARTVKGADFVSLLLLRALEPLPNDPIRLRALLRCDRANRLFDCQEARPLFLCIRLRSMRKLPSE